MLTRRALVGAAAAAAAFSGTAWLRASPSSAAQTLEPYVDRLPLPAVAAPVGIMRRGSYPAAPLYRLSARQIRQRFHRALPPTMVWGYEGSFMGPVIRATSGSPVHVEWRNDLPDGLHPLWADDFARAHGPGIGGTRVDARRIVTHLHGMKCPADSVGWPEEIILPDQRSRPYFYPNDQEAATLWYHDHALGITRLNVYMGLAGFYLLSDAWEQNLPLPRGADDLPLAIADRSFRPDGGLYYPMVIAPEMFGDYLVVNGRIAPYHEVARGQYRLRLLNACTARFLTLGLSDLSPFQQIASEQGLLPRPVDMTSIRLAPGERAEIVIDFADRRPGSTVKLVNHWIPDVFPGDLFPPASPEPVLQFRIGAAWATPHA